jgi:hypothetical protein
MTLVVPTQHPYPPNCPKCGGGAIAPARAGMSVLSFQCTVCDHRFSFSFPLCDVGGLAGKTSSAETEAILANCNMRIPLKL